MTVTEDQPIVPRAVVERVKAILLKPAQEWAVIDAEPATIKGIYTGYLVYLAAIGPVARFIGDVLFLHASVVDSLIAALLSYGLWLAGTYLMALVIEALAFNFGAEKNRIQAFKVAAYSSTASAVAGAFAIIPFLSFLAIFGLYSLYLLWLGLPKLMRAPEDKALTYYAAVIGVVLIAALVIGAFLTPLLMVSRFGI